MNTDHGKHGSGNPFMYQHKFIMFQPSNGSKQIIFNDVDVNQRQVGYGYPTNSFSNNILPRQIIKVFSVQDRKHPVYCQINGEDNQKTWLNINVMINKRVFDFKHRINGFPNPQELEVTNKPVRL